MADGTTAEEIGADLDAELGLEAGPGMPQLDFATFPNQIFWLVVALFALYFILTRFAIPQIRGALEDRDQVLSGDLETAAELRAAAEQAEADYNKALADARAEAQKIAAETKAEIQAELDAALAKADAEIAARQSESEARIAEIRAEATRDVQTVSKDVARSLVDALMPGSADGDAIDRAVDARVKG
ncbi:MAG: F0F1 ATP synthase subunit B' [Pseudomonadota bacterium]